VDPVTGLSRRVTRRDVGDNMTEYPRGSLVNDKSFCLSKRNYARSQSVRVLGSYEAPPDIVEVSPVSSDEERRQTRLYSNKGLSGDDDASGNGKSPCLNTRNYARSQSVRVLGSLEAQLDIPDIAEIETSFSLLNIVKAETKQQADGEPEKTSKKSRRDKTDNDGNETRAKSSSKSKRKPKKEKELMSRQASSRSLNLTRQESTRSINGNLSEHAAAYVVAGCSRITQQQQSASVNNQPDPERWVADFE